MSHWDQVDWIRLYTKIFQVWGGHPGITNTQKPNLFDYMNVKKKYNMENNKQEDVRLLYKGSQRYKGKETKKSNMYLTHELDNIMTILDNAF